MVLRRRCGLGAGVAVATLVLGACGDTGAAPAADDPPTSSAAPSDATASPSSATTAESATGERVRTETFSLRVPEGFRVSEEGATVTATGPSGDRLNFATVPLYSEKSLRQLVGVAVGHGSWDSRPERLPDVLVDGVEMYHLSGPAGPGVTRDELGAQTDATFSYADFDLRGSASERRQLITSVLGSWRWR